MFSNADEVLKFIKDEDVKFVDVRFCDLPGVMQHFNVPGRGARPRTFFTDGQMFDGSSIRGFQAIHESDMKLIPDLDDAPTSTRSATEKTLIINFSIRRPVHRRAVQPRPAQHRREGRGVPRSRPASPTPRSSAPRPSSTSSTTCASRPSRTRATTTSTPIEGAWNTGRDEEGGNLGYKTRYKGGYFPVPPVDHFADLRDEMSLKLDRGRPQRRARPPRGRHRRPGGDQLPLRHAAARRPTSVMLFKYIIKNVAWDGRQDRDLHAEAALRRQRLGHALPPVAVEGRRAAVLRRGRLRRPVGHRPLVHRRPAQARAVAAGLHQPDGELLPPPGARLRGPGQPGLLGQRNRSACIRIPITGSNPKAKRIEFRVPDPSSNPYLAFSAHADGRPRRHQEQDRAAASRSTRTSTSCPRTRPRPSRRFPARWPRCSTRSRPTTTTCTEGGVFTDGPDRDLDRLQAHQRDRPDPPAPAPARVRAVLRLLTIRSRTPA